LLGFHGNSIVLYFCPFPTVELFVPLIYPEELKYSGLFDCIPYH